MNQTAEGTGGGAAAAGAGAGAAGGEQGQASGAGAAAGGTTAPGSEDALWGGGLHNDSAEDKAKPAAKPPDDDKTKQKPETKPATPPAGLVALPDDATDEQRADFDSKMRALNRVPAKPEDYGDFGFGKDKPDVKIDTAAEDYKHYTKLFHDAGLNPKQARLLLEKHLEWSHAQVEHHNRLQETAIQQYRDKVKADFVKSVGGESVFKDYSNTAARGFQAAAQGAGMSGEEIRGVMNIMRDDPRFLKIFHNIGTQFREDVLVSGARAAATEADPDEYFENKFAKMFNSGGK
jgi:hypothetical protein